MSASTITADLVRAECPRCEGDGYRPVNYRGEPPECDECGGTGEVEVCEGCGQRPDVVNGLEVCGCGPAAPISHLEVAA